MAQFPALPLFTDAYLGDTTHLTTIEHGAYFLLLMATWRSKDCRLINDDKLLARYTKLSAKQWLRIKPLILDFFDEKNGYLYQGRLTDEHAFVLQRSRQQSDNAKARWLKTKETTDTTALPEECHRYAPTPTPTPTIKTIQKNGFHFEDFYQKYPLKKGRKKAEASYLTAIKAGTVHDRIMEGLDRYIADIKKNKTERRFIAHPATWLNQGRWDDEYEAKTRRNRS